jgi:hypothetical protein
VATIFLYRFLHCCNSSVVGTLRFLIFITVLKNTACVKLWVESGSGSGSAQNGKSDPDPDRHQNEADSQHRLQVELSFK